MTMLPILITSRIHIFLKYWENVLFGVSEILTKMIPFDIRLQLSPRHSYGYPGNKLSAHDRDSRGRWRFVWGAPVDGRRRRGAERQPFPLAGLQAASPFFHSHEPRTPSRICDFPSKKHSRERVSGNSVPRHADADDGRAREAGLWAGRWGARRGGPCSGAGLSCVLQPGAVHAGHSEAVVDRVGQTPVGGGWQVRFPISLLVLKLRGARVASKRCLWGVWKKNTFHVVNVMWWRGGHSRHNFGQVVLLKPNWCPSVRALLWGL